MSIPSYYSYTMYAVCIHRKFSSVMFYFVITFFGVHIDLPLSIFTSARDFDFSPEKVYCYTHI